MKELERNSDFIAPQLVGTVHGPDLGGMGRPGDIASIPAATLLTFALLAKPRLGRA